MAFTPLHDLIVVLPDPVAEKTTGGIIVTGSHTPYHTGTVIAVNPGTKSGETVTPCPIKVGSRIAYGNRILTIAVQSDDLNMLIDKKPVKNAVMMKESDVLAVIIEGIS